MSGKTRPPSKPEMRGSITVLVLGDESVGKSSLISTFVSHHFSEVVPGIMTRVRLPPDPDSQCITSIVDSQGGDAALISAVAALSLEKSGESSSLLSFQDKSSTTQPQVATGITHVDSIVLVYDLDRIETFYRLENHWLPLIERCYNGEMPVIVAGNKMDLLRGNMDEESLARSRQEIVALMQRFRFVRQCIKCSAKNLLRVDEVFVKAQQAVLYPFTPLYDLNTGRLTDNCRRAFTRIFRMYDQDHDGLLSNTELDNFQNQTFHVPLVEKDLSGWKKVVQRNNPTPEQEVVKDGKFTVAGILAIFDVFISQNRLDVPWRVLRKFGHDDDLVLHIPSSVSGDEGNWKLSSSARKFLAALFHQFDSNQDGLLSADDVANIFSIMPQPSLPPWHPMRSEQVFEGCFSLPKAPPSPTTSSASGSSTGQGSDGTGGEPAPMALSQSLSASGITICSASSLPTVDMEDSFTSQQQPMTYLDWIGQWHMIAAISPSIARNELYALGCVEESGGRRRHRHSSKKRRRKYSGADVFPVLPSQEVRVLLLGSRGSGKTALLNCLVGDASSALETTPTLKPETTTTHMTLKKQPKSADEQGEEFAVHLVFTEVPQADDNDEKLKTELKQVVGSPTSKSRFCDLVVLSFDASNASSLEFCKTMEAELLTDDVARIYVATKGDQVNDTVLNAAKEHCKELDLESPLVTSATELGSTSSTDPAAAGTARATIVEQLAKCVLQENGVEQLKSKPHAEKKRKEAAKRRKMIWLGGLVGVSVAVAVGVGVLWSGGKAAGGERKGRFGWLRHILSGGIVGMSSSSSSTAQS